MIDFYNAFISYKHADLDTKVAEDVQRSLERFKIPSAIRKKTGNKKIERIFRDKDELPITSDLSSAISNALEKSEYLIVICSPNTKKSMWVTREIEGFLKNHTKDKVLTVLAGGESKEVIPKELREDELEIDDVNGNTIKTITYKEPLACDYRMPFKLAHKEEIPRLVAALTGCSYDELVRRKRQYKMRRLGIAFGLVMAVVMTFAGYMFYSRQQIDKNYKESLANQSRFLANESLRLYENNQRVDALLLALASLPSSDKDDRPVTAESIRALTTATHAYQSQDSAPYELFWDYKMPNRVRSFVVSSDSVYLAAIDYIGNLIVWNTEDHSIVLETNENDSSSISFAKDDSLLIWDEITVKNYNIPDGNIRWSYDLSDNYSDEFSYNKHNEHVLTGMYVDSITEKKDGTLLLPIQYNSLLMIDVYSGNVRTKIDFSDKFDDISNFRFISFTLSPDENQIAFEGWSDEYSHLLATYNFSSEKSCYKAVPVSLDSMEWADDSHVVVEYHDTDNGNWGSLQIGYLTIISDLSSHIQCYEVSNLNTLWDNTITNRGVGQHGLLAQENDKTIIYYAANSIYVFDVNTGKTTHGGSIDGQIMDVTKRDADSMPVFFTDSGDRVIFNMDYSSNAFIYGRRLVNHIDRAIQSNGVYVHQFSDSRILYYSKWVVDNDWKNYNDDYEFYNSYSTKAIIEDGIMTILAREKDDDVILRIYDLEDYRLINSVDLSEQFECDFFYVYPLGIFDNTLYLYSDYHTTEYVLISIDISSGEIESKNIGWCSNNIISMKENKIAYVERKDYSKTVVSVIDLTDVTSESFSLDFLPDFSYLTSSGNIICGINDNIQYINSDTGEMKSIIIPDTWNGTTLISENASGSLFVMTDDNEIIIVNDSGIVQTCIQCDGMKPIGFEIEKINSDNEETLLVAFQNSRLNRYNVLTGELLGSSIITVYTDVEEHAEFIYDKKRKQLYIDMTSSLDIVETETWVEIAIVEDCIGYSGNTDKFIAWRGDDAGQNHRIGYYDHYSLEDLKNKADSLLINTEMSEEFRSQYGI